MWELVWFGFLDCKIEEAASTGIAVRGDIVFWVSE